MSCERFEQFSGQQMYPNANIRKNFYIFNDNFDIQLFHVHLIWHLKNWREKTKFRVKTKQNKTKHRNRSNTNKHN